MELIQLFPDSFMGALASASLDPPERLATRTLQVNLGRLCNMACLHCHVDGGPNSPEVMSWPIAERMLELLAASPGVETLDLTGGAPELNPHFRQIVARARALGKRVIDRCNLTVLLEPGQEDLAEFLAEMGVEVVASLPCYLPENVKRQRGSEAFERSIEALRRLNALGYGLPGTGLRLNLVYNPGGPYLPPPQETLEEGYRKVLGERYGIVFSHLLTLINMPINRFAHALERDGTDVRYRSLLRDSFNPATVDGLMCRSLVSVAWDGRLFDCDFNQILDLPLPDGPPTIFGLESLEGFEGRRITLGDHCFGCTAGCGSSCSGALQ